MGRGLRPLAVSAPVAAPPSPGQQGGGAERVFPHLRLEPPGGGALPGELQGPHAALRPRLCPRPDPAPQPSRRSAATSRLRRLLPTCRELPAQRGPPLPVAGARGADCRLHPRPHGERLFVPHHCDADRGARDQPDGRAHAGQPLRVTGGVLRAPPEQTRGRASRAGPVAKTARGVGWAQGTAAGPTRLASWPPDRKPCPSAPASAQPR